MLLHKSSSVIYPAYNCIVFQSELSSTSISNVTLVLAINYISAIIPCEHNPCIGQADCVPRGTVDTCICHSGFEFSVDSNTTCIGK